MRHPILKLAVVLTLGALTNCGSPPPATAPQQPRAVPKAALSPPPASSASASAEPPSPPLPPPPAASAEPPYDLANDIAVRSKEAREELGKRTTVEIVEETFVVVAPNRSEAVTNAAGVTKFALRAYLNGRFSRRPERAVFVYLFSEAGPYEAYCRAHYQGPCSSPYGFYVHADRRIVMNVGPGIGTLTHELVHPLVAVDFPRAPDWINEGIASLFEQPFLGKPGQIHGGKNWRHPRLLQALQSKTEREHASLPALFALRDEEFRGVRESLNYAIARYFCQWLDQKNQLWPFYQRWRDNYANDPTGEKAFLEVVGKSPAEADADWAQWVRRL